MVVALGFWALAIGYATLYTGVQGFTSGSGSLAANLGLSSLTPSSTSTNQTQAHTTTGSASDLSSVAAAGTSAAATAGAAGTVLV